MATGDPRKAAAAAGYAHPDKSGYRVLARPAMAAEVRRLESERMAVEGMPKAVQVILDCMDSKTAPWSDKLRAAKIVTDYNKQEGGAAEKEPHQMTADEIAMEYAALKARLIRIQDVEFVDDTPPGGVFE